MITLQRKLIFAGIAALLSGALFLFFWNGTENQDGIVRKKPLPELTLKNYDGAEIKLADLKGKPLVINMWASWCPFCREELSHFTELQKELGDRVMIVAVNRGEQLETTQQFSSQSAEGPRMTFLLDPEDTLYPALGGFSMPETIFVDAEGNIAAHKRGPMTLEEMRRRAQETFGFSLSFF